MSLTLTHVTALRLILPLPLPQPVPLTLTPIKECGSLLAIPFFFSYIVLGNFLMLNIFTAVILRNFADAAMDEGLAGLRLGLMFGLGFD